MTTIRWGIIGCGNVCEVKSGPGFQEASGSALVSVMRRDGAKAADFAQRHGVAHWTADAQELIDDSQVDAVYVATPPGSHLQYALAVAAAGKPCYVEKPMARNHRECQQMIDAFDRANVPLFVGYYRRRLPRFLKAEQLLREGRIGTVTSVHYRMTRAYRPEPSAAWRVDVEQSGGGIFLDVGSHTLDVLDYLLGPLQDVTGSAVNFGPNACESTVQLAFRTPAGALGSATWNFAGDRGEDLIEIVGTQGRITLSTFGEEPVLLETADGRECFDLPHPPHVHQPLIQTIVDELRGQGQCPSTGRSAARTQRVMDIALESFYAGRDDDFWARPQTWVAATGL
jgi:1,5-anhydro-D-fructose reductase (1,5-anhydro-D-mannitol-forming)